MMKRDKLQEIWQSQSNHGRIAIDADLLLVEVRRNHRSFQAVIFWRDVREVGVSLFCAALFAYWAATGMGWQWSVLAVGVLAVALFMLADRLYQGKNSPGMGESLLDCATESLARVEHQIWLLKNVAWWYLLPPGIGFATVCGHAAWRDVRFSGNWLIGLAVFVPMASFFAVIAIFVYWLNQHAVRTELEPRREELQALVDSIRATGE